MSFENRMAQVAPGDVLQTDTASRGAPPPEIDRVWLLSAPVGASGGAASVVEGSGTVVEVAATVSPVEDPSVVGAAPESYDGLLASLDGCGEPVDVLLELDEQDAARATRASEPASTRARWRTRGHAKDMRES